jgi:hypothetical protein
MASDSPNFILLCSSSKISSSHTQVFISSPYSIYEAVYTQSQRNVVFPPFKQSPYIPSRQVGSSELLSMFTKFFVFWAYLNSNLCPLCSLRNKIHPKELLPAAYYINNHIFNM